LFLCLVPVATQGPPGPLVAALNGGVGVAPVSLELRDGISDHGESKTINCLSYFITADAECRGVELVEQTWRVVRISTIPDWVDCMTDLKGSGSLSPGPRLKRYMNLFLNHLLD
jgi:hypothetical protein